MDVNQVLEGTLSPDATIRQNAEQQLTQAANVDFPGYVSTLAHELANEQAQPHIRTAAGIALKNAFSSREFPRLREVQEKWLRQVDLDVKRNVKQLALRTLASNDTRAGQSAAQFIASIAAIEVPREQWPELMPSLVQNVTDGASHLKQASLTTIGFICESEDGDLRDSLAQHSNAILTAVVQGARKEEPEADVRHAAISALGDSLEFVKANFENEGERNYIMQVICEATQSDDVRVQQGAFGCLNRIMAIYYDKMQFYMEKALFGLTIMGMKSEEEDVAKLAVEFWSTVCEEELNIEDDNVQAHTEGAADVRLLFNFARVATPEVVPVLLQLLTRQDEDATDDEYNISRAAYQCLQLYAQAVGGQLIPPVLGFVELNLRNESWRNRDAAVSAFGAIMDGPDDNVLLPLVRQALPVLMSMISDSSAQVQDSAAYALGRICESVPDAIEPATTLAPLIGSLFAGLSNNPKMASSCCWALMNVVERFSEPGAQMTPLSPHFQESVSRLLQATERNDADGPLRTAAYEVLYSLVTYSATDVLPLVADLSNVILRRLDSTVSMQNQIVSVEDRLTLEEIQTSLTSVLLAIIQRLEREIQPQADRIMQTLLSMLHSLGPKSSVPEIIFTTVGALANVIEKDFAPYMEPFAPFFYSALGNQEDASLCSVATGLVSDITRSIGELAQPYCDAFMNHLLNNLRVRLCSTSHFPAGTGGGPEAVGEREGFIMLTETEGQSTTLSNQFKPAILQCFGDIAQAIGGHFEMYLTVVAQVLQQAATVTAATAVGSSDMSLYVLSLREGIMDAWGAIVNAMRSSEKPDTLRPYVESIFQLLHSIWEDGGRVEALMRASMGVLGDLAEAFPNGDYAQYYQAEWVTLLVKEVRSNRDNTARTIDTARWAREQVKRQLATIQSSQNL